jgi:hypothetical protein
MAAHQRQSRAARMLTVCQGADLTRWQDGQRVERSAAAAGQAPGPVARSSLRGAQGRGHAGAGTSRAPGARQAAQDDAGLAGASHGRSGPWR